MTITFALTLVCARSNPSLAESNEAEWTRELLATYAERLVRLEEIQRHVMGRGCRRLVSSTCDRDPSMDGASLDHRHGVSEPCHAANVTAAGAKTGASTAVEGVKTFGDSAVGLVEGGSDEAKTRWKGGARETKKTARDGRAETKAAAQDRQCH